MSRRFPSRSRLKSRFRRAQVYILGAPKFTQGDKVGDFTVLFHQGHSEVNKRNNHIMAKPQHWYRCECSCGTQESRTQQELIDTRRSQCCFECRELKGETDEDPS